MTTPKIFVGPMSKNIVDCCIEFSRNSSHKIGLIPSRRQIEKRGGYVNNWDTQDFAHYSDDLILKRDHAGPNQGQEDDDGFESLEEDCRHFDYIHIDPWKKYPDYKRGLQWTAEMIRFCYERNPQIKYEIATEESIRKFSSDDLDKLVDDLFLILEEKVFNQIKYLVIQSGTSLKETSNTGAYDKARLISMLRVAKSWGLLSKEHNGDYISAALIKEKMSLGLDSINIAPEFGLIETNCYLESDIDFEKFWEICFLSRKWEKWVDSSFDPHSQKVDLVKICGHYVFSDPEFLKIKPDIENKIKFKINEKLHELSH